MCVSAEAIEVGIEEKQLDGDLQPWEMIAYFRFKRVQPYGNYATSQGLAQIFFLIRPIQITHQYPFDYPKG